MKRFFTLLIALIALVSIDCNAQNLVGVNAYYTMNSVNIDSYTLKKKIFPVQGSIYGIVYKHMELRNIIGFQAGINVENSGFRIEPNESTVYETKLKYVNVPIMAHVDIGKHVFKGLFAIGAYGNFLSDYTKPEFDYGSNSEPDKTIEDNSAAGGEAGAATENNAIDYAMSDLQRIHESEFNKLSYGLCAEAGFAICSRVGVFQFTGRVSVGMSNMYKFDGLSILNYVTPKSYGFGVSYLVPFGKGDKYYTRKEKVKKEELENEVVSPVESESGAEESSEIDVQTPSENGPSADKPAAPESEENWEERMNE